MQMEDFSLRWYVQDHQDYLEKEVLLKRPSSKVWKFPYYYLSSDDLTFVAETSRKTVSSGDLMQPSTIGEHYFCITTDGLQDGPSGISDAWESFFDPMLIAGHSTASNPNPLGKYPDDASWIYTGVGPVGSGMDTRFGYIEFEDNPQGEFSPSAGW